MKAYILSFRMVSKAKQNDSSSHGVASNSPRSDSEIIEFVSNDAYRTLRRLEAGEEGPLTISRSKSTGTNLVIKTVQLRQSKYFEAQDGGRRKPLPNEARILLSRLGRHPNIVRLFAAEPSPKSPIQYNLFLEYCSGGDLLDQLKAFRAAGHAVPPMFTLHVVTSMAHALAYIHHGLRRTGSSNYSRTPKHAPIIHGDIKPDNIFLRWPGKQECGMPDIVLADFGMSQVASESWGFSGTEGYDSPEVHAITSLRYKDPPAYRRTKNARIMSTKSDVYQLGLVMYLMATGRGWETGADPQTLEVPERYRRIVGIIALLVWLLQPLAKNRPDCSADYEDGLLLAARSLEKRRDQMYRERGPLRRSVWNITDMNGG